MENKRISILKQDKPVEDITEKIDAGNTRKVRFSSNFVKPFTIENNETIWDNTYEEEIWTDPHSTVSIDSKVECSNINAISREQERTGPNVTKIYQDEDDDMEVTENIAMETLITQNPSSIQNENKHKIRINNMNTTKIYGDKENDMEITNLTNISTFLSPQNATKIFEGSDDMDITRNIIESDESNLNNSQEIVLGIATKIFENDDDMEITNIKLGECDSNNSQEIVPDICQMDFRGMHSISIPKEISLCEQFLSVSNITTGARKRQMDNTYNLNETNSNNTQEIGQDNCEMDIAERHPTNSPKEKSVCEQFFSNSKIVVGARKHQMENANKLNESNSNNNQEVGHNNSEMDITERHFISSSNEKSLCEQFFSNSKIAMGARKHQTENIKSDESNSNNVVQDNSDIDLTERRPIASRKEISMCERYLSISRVSMGATMALSDEDPPSLMEQFLNISSPTKFSQIKTEMSPKLITNSEEIVSSSSGHTKSSCYIMSMEPLESTQDLISYNLNDKEDDNPRSLTKISDIASKVVLNGVQEISPLDDCKIDELLPFSIPPMQVFDLSKIPKNTAKPITWEELNLMYNLDSLNTSKVSDAGLDQCYHEYLEAEKRCATLFEMVKKKVKKIREYPHKVLASFPDYIEKIKGPPKRLVTRIQEHCKNFRRKGLEIRFTDDDDYCEILTLWRSAKVQITLVENENPTVENVECISMIGESSKPMSHSKRFVHNLFMKKFEKHVIESYLGKTYDIFTILDYIEMNFIECNDMNNEFENLEIEFAIQMNEEQTFILRIYSEKLLVGFRVHIDFTNMSNITESCVTIKENISRRKIKDKDIKGLINGCPESYRFLRVFHDKIWNFIHSKYPF